MIDDSHRSHDQRRLLTSYKIFVHLLLQEFQTSLYGIQTFLLRDIIYAILRILPTCSSGNSGSVEEKLKLTLLCDLMNDVCNVAITVCPEVRSSINICNHYCYLSWCTVVVTFEENYHTAQKFDNLEEWNIHLTLTNKIFIRAGRQYDSYTLLW